MEYETLKKIRGTTATVPMVSITRDSIRFNAAARSEFGLDSRSHAELQRGIGAVTIMAIKLVEAANKETTKAIKAGVISAGEWIKPYSLPAGVYPVSFDEANSRLEFDIKNGKALRKAEIKEVKPRFKKAA